MMDIVSNSHHRTLINNWFIGDKIQGTVTYHLSRLHVRHSEFCCNAQHSQNAVTLSMVYAFNAILILLFSISTILLGVWIVVISCLAQSVPAAAPAGEPMTKNGMAIPQGSSYLAISSACNTTAESLWNCIFFHHTCRDEGSKKVRQIRSFGARICRLQLCCHHRNYLLQGRIICYIPGS